MVSSTESCSTFVYRISNADEWERAQRDGGLWGSEMDQKSNFVHLSTEEQVWQPGSLRKAARFEGA